MSAKEEIMFTHKYSSENQPHLNAAQCPLCCQWFRRCLFHMYFFIVIVFSHYVLCNFCCHSTQRTQLLVQSKCIKAEVIYVPSAMRQDCMLTPAAVTWVSSIPAISLQPEHSPKVSAHMGLQLKMDQKASKKSHILSYFLVYVSSSLCEVFLELKTVFLIVNINYLPSFSEQL